jgi:large subunit ribosomal protein L22
VADTIRGKSVDEAERQLQFTAKWASQPLLKLLRSAIANAKHNAQRDRSTLRIAKITVDQGPTLKRYRPRAFGSAAMIRKRSSHVSLVLFSPDEQKKEKGEARDHATEQRTKPTRLPSKERSQTPARQAASPQKKGTAQRRKV